MYNEYGYLNLNHMKKCWGAKYIQASQIAAMALV